MPKRLFVDTNIFLRAIRADTPEQTEAAARLFVSAANKEIELITNGTVIQELVHIMESQVWQQASPISKEEIRRIILAIVNEPYLEVIDAPLIIHAMSMYVDLNIKIGDALIAAWMVANKVDTICTFDAHFERVPEIASYPLA